MSWEFYEYACVYGPVDVDCDILLPGSPIRSIRIYA